MIKTLELFGGIGSPRKALLNLGVDIKAIDYVEIQENRVRAYNALYDHLHKTQSVVGWNLKPDILVHGSPCQDLSRIGVRKGAAKESGTRSSLMHETLKIIKSMGEWKPKFVVWENVKGVLDKDLIKPFNEYLREMNKLGYTNAFEVMDARDYGIPHARERVFCVSVLGDETFDFAKIKKKPMRPISNFLEYAPADYEKVPSEYLITIPSMLNKIKEFNPKPTGSYKRQLDVIEQFCYTITERQDRCPNAGILRMNNGQYRYLTERECWRLLGFEDKDYNNVAKKFPKQPGKRSATMYALAGNSIVVPVLEAIFEVLLSSDYAVKDDVTEKNGQLELVI
ncbi:DNA cytosine methyltransferase [Kurthia senegalensis]|uniref:DNA cytosine methyltransferase n=1 Tax=Kurthia senegalensis TaxID=1033740 RepID=UPI0002885E54|nr:DNA (cytosine-5-)-methyltransferase [Kurthia senegalensis]